MSDAIGFLSAIEQGDPSAAAQLLPLVYDELRRLARQKLAHEQPGQTLDATALVHEAYLRLIDVDRPQTWNGRRHFFAAASEAMRRILVERARRRRGIKHGGDRRRVQFPENLAASPSCDDDVLVVDEVLEELARTDPPVAELVKLHFFAGLTLEEAAECLGIPTRTAFRNWSYARAWMYRRLGGSGL